MIFYLFTKLVNFFLAPAYWIFILLIAGWIIKTKKVKRRLYVTALFIFILFSNKALFDVAANAWQPERTPLKDTSYTAGILLGGMSKADKDGNGYFTKSSDRFIQAIQLYHSGIIKKILITGGTFAGNSPEEADYIVPELIKAGVHPFDIVAENRSKNTYENALFSKQLLDSLSLPPPYVVITSALHILRAQRVFKKAGVAVEMYPANYLAVRNTPTITDILLPNIEALDDWKYLIKEMVGTWGYRFTNKA